jgi:hypothetical protein
MCRMKSEDRASRKVVSEGVRPEDTTMPIGDKTRIREFLQREEDGRRVVRDREGGDGDRPEVILWRLDACEER